jgi:hypothetical protein
MHAIRPIYEHRHHPSRHFDPVLKNIRPRSTAHVLGYDILLTPIHIAYGLSLNPLADTWFSFHSGAWVVDVAV